MRRTVGDLVVDEELQELFDGSWYDSEELNRIRGIFEESAGQQKGDRELWAYHCREECYEQIDPDIVVLDHSALRNPHIRWADTLQNRLHEKYSVIQSLDILDSLYETLAAIPADMKQKLGHDIGNAAATKIDNQLGNLDFTTYFEIERDPETSFLGQAMEEDFGIVEGAINTYGDQNYVILTRDSHFREYVIPRHTEEILDMPPEKFNQTYG